MAKLRVMPVFVEDVLSDATMSLLTAEEFGAYWRLLFYAWIEDGLSPNEDRLRRLARVHGRAWTRVWEAISDKFQIGKDGKLRNPRQENDRLRIEDKVEKARKAAKTGVAMRADAQRTLSYTGRDKPEPEQIKDPSDPCAPKGAPHQGEFDLEKGALPTEAGDLPAGEAIYAVFNHWRERYPEHRDAQLQGKRPALIKAAIANRRAAHGGAGKFSRRQAVDEIQGAIDAAKLDPWCAGQNQERTAVTELSALLAIEVLERLCRLATGERPAQVFVDRGQIKVPEAM